MKRTSSWASTAKAIAGGDGANGADFAYHAKRTGREEKNMDDSVGIDLDYKRRSAK
jgi:hypothetical protein